MPEIQLGLFENYKQTCSVTNIQDGCVTFIRNSQYLKYLSGIKKDAWVITPKDISTPISSTKGLKYYPIDYPEYIFTLFHNYIYINVENIIPVVLYGNNCKIHETVVLGVEGLKVVNAPDGSRIQFRHTGNIIIESDVEIGPYSVIHRGTMESTIIRKGCKFGAFTNIGHNCEIGENTIMAANVVLNGGVNVGKNCWFASGSLVRHHINICDDVVIGLGSVVLKDITKSGIYVGSPAKFLKPLSEGWNF